MKTSEFQSVVYKEGKYFVAQCLDIDVSSFGESEAEALAALSEALELYFDDCPNPSIQHVQNAKLRTLRLQHA